MNTSSMLYVWLATYESTFVEHPHPESAYSVGMLALAVQILMMPLCGMAVDRYGVRPCMMFGTIGTIVFAADGVALSYRRHLVDLAPNILRADCINLWGGAPRIYDLGVS